MKGDFSRTTFKKEKHYSSVRMQQGRVQLDADWNEQVDITAHRIETGATDVIGLCGAPKDNAGFEITANGDNFSIGRGRYYVNGILCESEEDVDFTGQPDLLNASLPEFDEPGIYLAYLDVWQRHITALEDFDIREVAIGGADTATRTKTVWQVKLQKVADLDETVDYDQFGPGWQPEGALSTGKLRAQVSSSGAALEIENQLYRVEIHKGGPSGEATFKWSENNGLLVSRIEQITDEEITISGAGRDTQTEFAPGQWVEVSDDARVLRGEPGILVQLGEVQLQEGKLTVVDWPDGPPELGKNATVRYWDGDYPKADAEAEFSEGIPVTSDDYLTLGERIEVQFDSGEYQTGDYWLIPSRALLGNVMWPEEDGEPAFEARHGIEHQYSALALLSFEDNTWTNVKDCRQLFWAATDIENLFVGCVSAFAMEEPPEGWLECNGKMYSKTKYTRLFNKIGFTFGNGNGDGDTFNVPDLRGEFIRGWDRDRGIDPGRVFGTHQADLMQSHKHNDSGHAHSDSGHTHKYNDPLIGHYPGLFHDKHGSTVEYIIPLGGTTATDYANIRTNYASISDPTDSGTGAGQPRHGKETRPQNVALLYCIKY